MELARDSRGDNRATQAILEYVKSPVDWSQAAGDKSWITSAVLVKARALDYLGMIGTPEAEQALLAAMTPEGAQSLSQTWLSGLPNDGYPSPDMALGRLRSYAAMGLAYFGADPKIHDLLKAAYTAEEQRLLSAGMTDSDYFSGLCDAMARLDILADIGPDAHDALYNDMEAMHNLYAEYYSRNNYSIRRQIMVGSLPGK